MYEINRNYKKFGCMPSVNNSDLQCTCKKEEDGWQQFSNFLCTKTIIYEKSELLAATHIIPPFMILIATEMDFLVGSRLRFELEKGYQNKNRIQFLTTKFWSLCK